MRNSVLVIFLLCVGCAGDTLQTVQIYGMRQDKTGSEWPVWGSGFFISATEIITARHVAEAILHSKDARILLYRGGRVHREIDMTGVSITMSARVDIALIQVPEQLDASLVPICEGLNPGEKIRVSGFTHSGYHDNPGSVWILNRGSALGLAHASNGMSGGPVISDSRGCAAGVLWGALGSTAILFVSTPEIHEFIDSARKMRNTW